MESTSAYTPTTVPIDSPAPLPFIHRFHILVKAHYFLFFAAFGSIYPVLSITIRARGLANTEIFLINTIIPFIVFFTNPLSGWLADRLRRYKGTFNALCLIVLVLYTVIFMLPHIKTRPIEADMYTDHKLGPVLDFCVSQEVVSKCVSRSTCGCSYGAKCDFKDPSLPSHLAFNFSMTSKEISKDRIEPSDMKTLPCGIEYRVPIEAELKITMPAKDFGELIFDSRSLSIVILS